jgi:hypothetical protein
LLRESALGSDVDDEKDFSAVLTEVGVFAGDPAYGNLMNGCAHIPIVVSFGPFDGRLNPVQSRMRFRRLAIV